MAINVVSFLFSSVAQPEARGLSFLLSAGFLLSLMDLQTQSGVMRAPSAGWWLALPHLQLVWLQLSLQLVWFQLSDFLSSPSYIIVQSPTQSPTQSLEWHVWSSSSGNNCHAVHRSLSFGASVYECTMGFLPCPILFSQVRLCDFSS